MEDDVSNVTESLDTLWFFSNVFSTKTTTKRSLVSEAVLTEEVSKPVSEAAAEREETRGRGNCNGKRGRRRKRRVVLGEIDLDGIVDIAKESTTTTTAKVSSSEYGSSLEGKYCGCCLYDHYKNMPSLRDNIAMKEHLKSWAYAVACIVK